ncbi:MAG: hypothetical protein NXI31_04280 [bacterium]|nr:hypothetical protein [bacterium]
MAELFQSSLPIQGATLVLALLLCLCPHLRRRGRTIVAGLLALPALGFVVDLLVADHDFEQRLEVPNLYGRAPDGDPHVWIVDTVTAPSWHWHLAVVGIFGTLALIVFLFRGRPGDDADHGAQNPVLSPNPVFYGAVVFWFFLGGRLLLEATAARQSIVWGFSGTVALFAILPFFGFWCARRGVTAGGYLLRLLALAFAQRIPLVLFGWLATTRELGTHLDTHVITDLMVLPFGNLDLATPTDRWVWPTLFPQLTIWVLLTLLFGTALGILPFWLGRRSPAPATN